MTINPDQSLSMKNAGKFQHLLFNYLTTKGILFSKVANVNMINRAMAKFSFDLKINPCILYGLFQDKSREIISIAHEAGHVVVYRKMSKEKVRNYLCSMYAASGIGLNSISPTGQEVILHIEARASIAGFFVLREIGVDKNDYNIITQLMSEWYATYEELCREEVVKKVRLKISKNKNASFLINR